ncbi:MAG: hypothetical protein Q7R89_00230 [bacterium]|nr:hypothetical protein [bacterium]
MKKFIVVVVLLVLGSQNQVLATSECQTRRLTANVWSRQALPEGLRKEVDRLISIAESRDTRHATDPVGYQGDDVSRTLGARLRKEVRVRAPVNIELQVFYRDPPTARVVEDLGVLRVMEGTGSVLPPDDPCKWIIETVWPEYFISPAKSGGRRRLWLFPEEWGKWRGMQVHGIVP